MTPIQMMLVTSGVIPIPRLPDSCTPDGCECATHKPLNPRYPLCDYCRRERKLEQMREWKIRNKAKLAIAA